MLLLEQMCMRKILLTPKHRGSTSSEPPKNKTKNDYHQMKCSNEKNERDEKKEKESIGKDQESERASKRERRSEPKKSETKMNAAKSVRDNNSNSFYVCNSSTTKALYPKN